MSEELNLLEQIVNKLDDVCNDIIKYLKVSHAGKLNVEEVQKCYEEIKLYLSVILPLVITDMILIYYRLKVRNPNTTVTERFTDMLFTVFSDYYIAFLISKIKEVVR